MEVEEPDAQCLAAAHLLEKGCAGLREGPRVRVAEVDQVAVMGEDLCRFVPLLPAVRAEGRDLFLGERLGRPLPLVPREEREGPRADLRRVQGRIADAAGRAHVGAQIFHLSLSPFRWGETAIPFIAGGLKMARFSGFFQPECFRPGRIFAYCRTAPYNAAAGAFCPSFRAGVGRRYSVFH